MRLIQTNLNYWETAKDLLQPAIELLTAGVAFYSKRSRSGRTGSRSIVVLTCMRVPYWQGEQSGLSVNTIFIATTRQISSKSKMGYAARCVPAELRIRASDRQQVAKLLDSEQEGYANDLEQDQTSDRNGNYSRTFKVCLNMLYAPSTDNASRNRPKSLETTYIIVMKKMRGPTPPLTCLHLLLGIVQCPPDRNAKSINNRWTALTKEELAEIYQ